MSPSKDTIKKKFILRPGKNNELIYNNSQSFQKWLSDLDDENENTFSIYDKDYATKKPGLYIALAIFHNKPKFALWLHKKVKETLIVEEIINCIQNACSNQQFEVIKPLLEPSCKFGNHEAGNHNKMLLLKSFVSIKDLPSRILMDYYIKSYEKPGVTEVQKSKVLRAIFSYCINKKNFEQADAVIKYFYLTHKNKRSIESITIELIEQQKSADYEAHFKRQFKSDKSFEETLKIYNENDNENHIHEAGQNSSTSQNHRKNNELTLLDIRNSINTVEHNFISAKNFIQHNYQWLGQNLPQNILLAEDCKKYELVCLLIRDNLKNELYIPALGRIKAFLLSQNHIDQQLIPDISKQLFGIELYSFDSSEVLKNLLIKTYNPTVQCITKALEVLCITQTEFLDFIDEIKRPHRDPKLVITVIKVLIHALNNLPHHTLPLARTLCFQLVPYASQNQIPLESTEFVSLMKNQISLDHKPLSLPEKSFIAESSPKTLLSLIADLNQDCDNEPELPLSQKNQVLDLSFDGLNNQQLPFTQPEEETCWVYLGTSIVYPDVIPIDALLHAEIDILGNINFVHFTNTLNNEISLEKITITEQHIRALTNVNNDKVIINEILEESNQNNNQLSPAAELIDLSSTSITCPAIDLTSEEETTFLPTTNQNLTNPNPTSIKNIPKVQDLETEIDTIPSVDVQNIEKATSLTPAQNKVPTTSSRSLRDNSNYLPASLRANCERRSKNTIQAGIANKYLGLYTIPMLPEENSHLTGAPLLPYQLGLNSQMRATSDNFKRNEAIMKNDSSILKLYTTQPITGNDKVIFVFAGRKENACYPGNPGSCRVVAVMTALEYENSDLPESIDILVVSKLNSHTHGDYSENLGCINSRRISAMLMAYELNLQSCIFMDDNLKTINTSKEMKDWEPLFDELNNLRKNRVCLSVRTHLNRTPAFPNNTLGSKLFMVDISQLKTKLPNTVEVFILFFPSACSNFWTEDYIKQLVILKAFGKKSVSIADKQIITLTRQQQYTNSCAKVFKKAEVHLEQTAAEFLGTFYNNAPLETDAKSWILFALENMRRIVKENVDYRTQRVQMTQGANLLESHALANHIPYDDKTDLMDTTCNTDTALSVNDFELYKHQQDAGHAINESDKPFELVNMTTGAGKTRLQIILAQIGLNKAPSQPIFIVTPTRLLVQQFYDDFVEYIKKTQSSTLAPHQVVKISSEIKDISAATLETNHSLRDKPVVMIFCKASFMKYIGQENIMVPQRVFLDECHMFSKPQVENIQKPFQGKATKILALSATPSNWMTKIHKPLYTYTRKQAVKDKIISPFILNTLGKKYSPDAVEQYIQGINTFLDTHIHPNGKNLSALKGIIYLPFIRDAQTCATALFLTSIPAYQAHSKVVNCQQQIEQFSQSKEPCVLLVVGMARAGYSETSLDYILDLQNTKAPDMVKKANDNAQKAGRVMRYRKDKIGYAVVFSDYDTSNFETTFDEEALLLCHDNFKKQSPGLLTREQQTQPTYVPLQRLKSEHQPGSSSVASWHIRGTQTRYTAKIPQILIDTALEHNRKTINFRNEDGKSIWLTLEETPQTAIDVHRQPLIELESRYRRVAYSDDKNESPCKRPRFS